MIAYEFNMHRLFLAAPQQPRNPTSNKIMPKENIVKNDIKFIIKISIKNMI